MYNVCIYVSLVGELKGNKNLGEQEVGKNNINVTYIYIRMERNKYETHILP
jgi:hypothetical protein